jgi:outer membrane receptor for ferrienterochelin and colicins
VDEALTQGIELLTRFDHEAFSLTLAYTYTDSENNETGLNLPYVPEHSFSMTPAYEYERYALGISCVLTCTGEQYKDSDNSSTIDGHSVLDARIYKKFGKAATLSLEADNILNSDKGDDGNYRSGRMFLAKLDFSF